MSIQRTLLIGLVIAILACIPTYQWIFHYNFDVLPFGWMAAGMSYMAVFFHEIGHTVFAWFYGYPTIPMFDFQHGGGFAYSFGDAQIAISVCIWAALGYGVFTLKDHKVLAGGLAALLLFNLATFYSHDLRLSVIDFMGPGLEPIIAGFFLYRAIFDLAPRGNVERAMNAIVGFGMIFRIFLDAAGLLRNEVHRYMYYNQKGMHGFGDFDKIASRFQGLNFEIIVYGWVGLTILCLVIPFTLLLLDRR